MWTALYVLIALAAIPFALSGIITCFRLMAFLIADPVGRAIGCIVLVAVVSYWPISSYFFGYQAAHPGCKFGVDGCRLAVQLTSALFAAFFGIVSCFGVTKLKEEIQKLRARH